MLTKQDKLYIETQIQLSEERIEERMEEKMEEKFTRFKFEIMNGIDTVIGELKAMREEMVAANGRLNRHDVQLDRHEERLVALEAN